MPPHKKKNSLTPDEKLELTDTRARGVDPATDADGVAVVGVTEPDCLLTLAVWKAIVLEKIASSRKIEDRVVEERCFVRS